MSQDYKQLYDANGVPHVMFRSSPEERYCWCGSNKKFKKCHKYLSAQPIAEEYKYLQVMRTVRDLSVSCIWCEYGERKKVIGSHSIQRGGALKAIAENGFVIGFHGNMGTGEGGALDVSHDPIGVRQASVFRCLCSRHDNDVFKDIETKPWTSSIKQVTQVAIRALLWEYCAKEKAIQCHKEIKGLSLLGRGYQDQHAFSQICDYRISFEIESRNKITELILHYIAIGERDDINAIGYLLVELDDVFHFAFNGNTVPDWDFTGNELQRSRDMGAVYSGFTGSSLVSVDGRSMCVFTWDDAGSNNAVNRFFDTMLTSLNSHDISAKVVHLALTMFENVYFRASVFNAFGDTEIRNIKRKHLSGTEGNIYGPQTLIEDVCAYGLLKARKVSIKKIGESKERQFELM